MISLFDRLESNVQYYGRTFPAVFKRAEGGFIFDIQGNRYIDFLCGAGSLNYGHNHPRLKAAILDYLQEDGILHSLDLYTAAKYEFMAALQSVILAPRGLEYKLQFTSPSGTNAVEAALKLARKVTGRRNVVAFTNAYHGVSLGALAATASTSKRMAAGVALDGVIRLPYDGFLGAGDDGSYLEAMLTKPGSGVDAPAAIILETIQCEGGLNTASASWLRHVATIAARIGALLIVDEIQVGCGRAGTFFSFDELPIVPDIVCLSKSLSGLGLPLSVVLLAPQHDIWSPGEHNGTFRGNNLAFVSGRAALAFWEDASFLACLRRNIDHLDTGLAQMAARFGSDRFTPKGRGMLRGFELYDPALTEQVRVESFQSRLIVETCGPRNSVVKLLPPLNVSIEVLDETLGILTQALDRCLTTGSQSVAVSS